MSHSQTDLEEVLKFWFEELTQKDWFQGGAELDTQITDRFGGLHASIAAGEYWKFRTTPENLLAEVVVLDQFSRQIYRGQAEAFASDTVALTIAQQAIAQNFDSKLTSDQRLFLYMPFMHSESRAIHAEAVKLFESLGNKDALKYEQVHKNIIDRFGRYPHRNQQLGRESTQEEEHYLRETNEDFFKS